jgi:ATP-binding cassette subfamily B multidrug efflux pump
MSTEQGHEPEMAGKLFDAQIVRRLLVFVRPYRAWMLVALVLLMAMSLTTNYLPLVIQRVVDQYLAPGLGLSIDVRMAGVVRMSGLALGVLAIAFVLRFAQGYLMTWVGQRIIFDLRAHIFDKILRLPLKFFDRFPIGRLMTRVTTDVESMQRFLTDGLVGLCADLFTLFGVIGYMFYLNPRLAMIVAVLTPLLLAILTFINLRIRGAHRLVRRRQAALNAFVQEMINGMATIQLFNREPYARKRYDRHNGELRNAFVQSIHWFSYFFPSMEVMQGLTLGLVIVFGGIGYLSGDVGLREGTLVAFFMYVRDFFRPLEDLSDKSNILQSAMASSERVFLLLDTPEDVQDPAQPAEPGPFRGEVAFDKVWFAYDQENWVLKDIGFTIRPGESVAIVGATGAGKTSITSLIARFYDVQRGSVRVDGVDVRDLRQADLRRRIGVVMQDPFVFSGTILDNIRLHNPEVGEERVREAARYVNAHRFIEERPGAYQSEVMERGGRLSTGQKQLLALARAIAQNPDILLILDEATANVDTETEQLIQDALRKLMKGRTSIIIAHRLSTIRHVDRILVMRHGEIVEQGSHENLIRQDGYYKKLYELLAHSPRGA